MLSWAELRSFARVTALCGTFGPLLTGMGSVATESSPPSAATVAVVLGVGLAFHIYAYVLNDVVDLPIDRTEPRRAEFPLVTGRVGRGQALAIAVAGVPLGLGLAALHRPDGSMGVLAAAYASMAVYDVWGKRSGTPFLTDLVQGLSWATLLWWGALAAGRPSALTGWLAASLVVFILLANGVHGSLRDLENDLRCGGRSTAIVLGARPLPGGGVATTGTLTAYAAVLHALVVLSVGAAVVTDPRASGITVVAVAVLAVGASALARRAWAARGDGWLMRRLGMLHLAMLLLLPLVAVAQHFSTALVVVLLIGVVAPIAANSWLPAALRSLLSARPRVAP